MGGKGSGGARVGSGRKSKSAAAHVFAGTARGKHRAATKAGLLPVDFVHEPKELTREAAAVWRELAPYAMAARTLTTATAHDMRELCEMVVEMRGVLEARRLAGWTDDGLKLAKEYRGLVQRVEGKMRAFRLAPIGKEMTEAAPAVVDPWAEFDVEGQAN
jgi:hypothetical protein